MSGWAPPGGRQRWGRVGYQRGSQQREGSGSASTQVFKGKCEDLRVTFLVVTRRQMYGVHQLEYISTNYKQGDYIDESIEAGTAVLFPDPDDPDDPTDTMQMRRWEYKMKKQEDSAALLKDNLKSAFSLMWGQCMEGLKARIM